MPLVMPAYALVIFDFDGTLADSFPWFCSVLNQTADKFGLNRVTPEQIERLRHRSSRDALKELGVPPLKLPAISIYMRELALAAVETIPLFKGAADMLERLDMAGVRLALVSSNGEAAVRRVLGDAAGRIDCYDCGASLWGKPGKFRSMLKRFGVEKAQTLAVGDEIRDIDAARDAGVAAGSVTFGFNTRDALVGGRPTHMFDSYDELVRTVLG